MQFVLLVSTYEQCVNEMLGIKPTAYRMRFDTLRDIPFEGRRYEGGRTHKPGNFRSQASNDKSKSNINDVNLCSNFHSQHNFAWKFLC